MPLVLAHMNSAIRLFDNKRIADDDGSSTSSTVAVFMEPKKRVRFSAANQSYENHTICQEDLKQICWYNPRDYRRFRAAALEASQQIIQVEARNRAPFSYQRVLEHTYDTCTSFEVDPAKTIVSASDFVHLQRWLEVASSRVGLEKWSIRKIASDKSARRRALNQVINDGQTYSNDLQQQHNEAEYLRESCVRLSRPSRLFARAMAQATAAAVQKDCFFDA